MLTHKPRKKETIKVVCPAGKLVPRPPFGELGVIIPKWQKFYNWPRGKDGQPLPDAPDFPKPEDIKEVTIEVPKDQHHAMLCHKGACHIHDASAPAHEAPKAASKKGGK